MCQGGSFSVYVLPSFEQSTEIPVLDLNTSLLIVASFIIVLESYIPLVSLFCLSGAKLSVFWFAIKGEGIFDFLKGWSSGVWFNTLSCLVGIVKTLLTVGISLGNLQVLSRCSWKQYCVVFHKHFALDLIQMASLTTYLRSLFNGCVDSITYGIQEDTQLFGLCSFSVVFSSCGNPHFLKISVQSF